MAQRLFFLLLLLTPTIVHGQITQYETITTISTGATITLLIADEVNVDFLDDNVLYRATYFRSKKPLFGSRRHRHTTVIGLDLGTAYGIHAGQGISQTSRFHQITLSAGLRLAYVSSVFVELQILAFPLKRIGIAGINFRVHHKLSNREVTGQIGVGITFASYRTFKQKTKLQ